MGATKKVWVLYTSLSGNTEETARIIAEETDAQGVDIVRDPQGLCAALHALRRGTVKLLFLGTYTWGDGVLPVPFRKFLRHILLEAHDVYVPHLPSVAVFGTGDTIFPRFCRAVDETVYHLQKHGVTVFPQTLKIEQSPYGLNQERRVRTFAREILQKAHLGAGEEKSVYEQSAILS